MSRARKVLNEAEGLVHVYGGIDLITSSSREEVLKAFECKEGDEFDYKPCSTIDGLGITPRLGPSSVREIKNSTYVDCSWQMDVPQATSIEDVRDMVRSRVKDLVIGGVSFEYNGFDGPYQSIDDKVRLRSRADMNDTNKYWVAVLAFESTSEMEGDEDDYDGDGEGESTYMVLCLPSDKFDKKQIGSYVKSNYSEPGEHIYSGRSGVSAIDTLEGIEKILGPMSRAEAEEVESEIANEYTSIINFVGNENE